MTRAPQQETTVCEPVESRCSMRNFLRAAAALAITAAGALAAQAWAASTERADLRTRAAVTEERGARMAEDLREIKGMLKQLLEERKRP